MFVMNRSLNYINILWKEIFCSFAFYGAIIIFIFLCAFGDAAEIDGIRYSVFEIFLDSDLYAKAANCVQCNSYFLILNYDTSPWFVVAISVITAFPGILIYEQNSGKFQMPVLIRMNNRKYILSLFFVIFFSGVLIAVIGIVIYSVIIKLTFPAFDNFNDEVLFEIYGKTVWSRVAALVKKSVNCCLVCGIFPVLSVICYCIFHDRFLSFTLPMMVQYISLKCSILYSSWLYATAERSENILLKFIYLLFPSNYTRCFSYLENNLHTSFVYFFILFSILALILYFIFDKLVRYSIGDNR